VAAAREILEDIGLKVPCLVGLAKREETLIFPDGREVVLGRRHAGLKLLIHVRDEAHRFCRLYYHHLQRKDLKS
ncbi:MAG: excinuclease ABC subunit C, partial [Planctomycetes bacterium]|nr:excinuclease ABC subunit C [Planctomycetota bacterium]